MYTIIKEKHGDDMQYCNSVSKKKQIKINWEIHCKKCI